MLTLNSTTRQLLDDIFSAVLIGGMSLEDNAEDKGKLYLQSLPLFRQKFKYNIFMNEYALFYTIIVDAKKDIFYEEYISTVIENNRDMILKSPFIQLDAFIYGSEDTKVEMQTDDTKLYAFEKECKRLYKELNERYQTSDIDLKRFNSACDTYIEMYIKDLQEDIPHKMVRIMSDDGFKRQLPGKRSKLYKGYDDALAYLREQDTIIRDFQSSVDERVFEVIDQKWLEKRIDNRGKTDEEPILASGLQEIDNVTGMLRRTNLLGILGPPKGGKTRLATHLVAKALREGLNVVIWPLEGTENEWNARLLSNIIYDKHQILIDDDTILKNDLTEAQRQYVYEAEVELAIGKGRGTVSYINTPAYSEDFLSDLKSHYERHNQFDVIVIDQLINIQSRSGRTKNDRISDSYEALKAFLKTGLPKEILAIIPSQLKQSTIDYLRAHPNETIDVTAGGESAATIRTPDYIWGLFSTKEERANGMVKLYDVGSRHSTNFGDFYASCQLGACMFWSDASLNNVYSG